MTEIRTSCHSLPQYRTQSTLQTYIYTIQDWHVDRVPRLREHASRLPQKGYTEANLLA
uniref:Uncharacterized protein n=1 Tax=Arion vulgaris TaxID=1028688 RepID=A0A0B7AHJ9_9EUPU